MIQIDQQRKLTQGFCKEYARLYFERLQEIASEIVIEFARLANQHHLPAIFLDTMRENPCVYLLSWKESQSTKIVFIRSAYEKQWVKVSMNSFPRRVAITDDHAFLFGAKEVIMVGLKSLEKKTVKLEDAKIVDMKLCYAQSRQPGVSVIYFNNKMGYFTKQYSKSSQVSFWGQLKTIFLSLTLKKNQQYEFFQIILPNLVGISLKNKTLFLYDLNKVTVTPLEAPFQAQLLANPPIIRWKFDQSTKGLNEALHIFILAKSKILHYVLHIARVESGEAENTDKNVSLQFVARGGIIDWSKSIFEKSDFQINSAFQITSFQVNNQQIIYREECESLGQIPSLQRIRIKDYKKKTAIISQQSTVWYQYFRNPENSSHFLSRFKQEINQQNSIAQYLSSSGKKTLKIENDSLYYLNKWRQNNKFQSFLIFNKQIYIVRTNSITFFDEISPLQYQLQNYSEQDKHRDEELKKGNRLKQNNKFSNISQQQILQEYKTIIKEIKGYVDLNHNFSSQKINRLQFLPSKSTLFVNTLRDKVDYYDEIISYVFSELRFEQKLYKNSQILRFIAYLKSCYFQSNNLSNTYGANFTSLFIQKIQGQLVLENQLNFIIFFKKLLKNLLPESFIAEQAPRASLTTNQYMEFFIDFILISIDEEVTQFAQRQLRRFISTIYPQHRDKTQSYIINNISFVKAYFLSHPSDQELLPFCQSLIKSSNYRQITEKIKQIFSFIPNQMEVLIKAELSLKKNQISLHIFKSSSLVKLNSHETIQKRGYEEIASQILVDECNLSSQDQKRMKDFTEIRKYFEKISYLNFDQYNKIQKNLLKVYQERISFEIMNQNFSYILELEEIILIGFLKIFHCHFKNVLSVQPNKIQAFQQFMMKILCQVQLSFSKYTKYFEKLYEFERREIIGGTNMIQISRHINYEESLMVNGFLEEPLKIQGNYLSSILISLLKKIVDSQFLLRLSSQNELNFTSDELTDAILKDIFVASCLNNEEIDILYYLFMKKGQRYMRRVFRKVSKSAPEKVMKYFERVEDKDALYRMSEDIVGDRSKLTRETIFA